MTLAVRDNSATGDFRHAFFVVDWEAAVPRDMERHIEHEHVGGRAEEARRPAGVRRVRIFEGEKNTETDQGPVR